MPLQNNFFDLSITFKKNSSSYIHYFKIIFVLQISYKNNYNIFKVKFYETTVYNNNITCIQQYPHSLSQACQLGGRLFVQQYTGHQDHSPCCWWKISEIKYLLISILLKQHVTSLGLFVGCAFI